MISISGMTPQIMDHEFGNGEPPLNLSGYKVDGNAGIKTLDNDFRCLKSVDYLYPTSFGLVFIEFSDLLKQSNEITEIKLNVKKALQTDAFDNFNQKYKKRINTLISDQIKNELRGKILQSWLMLSIMEEHEDASKIENLFRHEKFFFLIVIKKNEPHEGDILKFIENNNSKFKENYPKKICHIRILTVDKLETYISSTLPELYSLL